MPAGRSLWDQLIDGVGDAITDIRQKLVEEPWYGRTLDANKSDFESLFPGLEQEVDRNKKNIPEHETKKNNNHTIEN